MAGVKAQVVRFHHKPSKLKFEIMAKPGTVLKYRDGLLGIGKVLLTDQVFTNSVKGDLASAEDLSRVFETSNLTEVCEIIINKGEVQLTAAERKGMQEAKEREVIHLIHRNWMDPKSKRPHPPDRIRAAMAEAKFRVDPQKDALRQAEDAVKKMAGKLVFAKAVCMTARLTLKHAYVGTCSNIVSTHAKVLHTDWTGTGAIYTVELTTADFDILTAALGKPTGGDFDFTVVDENAPKPAQESRGKDRKKKKKKKQKKDLSPEELAQKERRRQKRKERKAKREGSSGGSSDVMASAATGGEAGGKPRRKEKKEKKKKRRSKSGAEPSS